MPCHMTNTKEMPSLLDGNQTLLNIGRLPRTRIPRSATPFPAIRILRCLHPNLGEILELITDGRSVVERITTPSFRLLCTTTANYVSLRR